MSHTCPGKQERSLTFSVMRHTPQGDSFICVFCNLRQMLLQWFAVRASSTLPLCIWEDRRFSAAFTSNCAGRLCGWEKK